MEPSLSLAYSSRGGNGILGVGWSIDGLSVVHRCPRTVAQDGAVGGIAFDADDRFCLDGQRLVAVSGTYGANGTEYRTEIESFAKIVSLGSAGAGPQRFQVWTKTGQILEYGFTADARLTLDNQPDVQVWALNRVSDTLGNYMTLHYLNDTVADTHVIDRIEYAGNTGAGTVPQSQVQFVYETRPDPMSHYQYGSLINSTQRLASIETHTDGAKVKDYRLTYEQSPNTQRSRLTAITECAANSNCLAPTTLSWRTPDKGFVWEPRFWSSGGIDDSDAPNSPNYGAFVDLNGDGRQDWIESYYDYGSGRRRRGAWLSTETGWLRSPQHDPPFYLSTSSIPTSGQFVDFNGDGLQDYIESYIEPGGFTTEKAWLNTGSGWARSTAYDPGFLINGYNSLAIGKFGEFVDLNGDGLIDWLTSYTISSLSFVGIASNAWLNTGSGWVHNTGFATPFYVRDLSPTTADEQERRGEFVDVNGDGLIDWVQSNNTESGKTWLNTGSGWQRSPAHDPVFSIYKTDVTPAQKLGEFVDVNGDGLMDWVNAHRYSDTGVIQETWLSTGDGWELSPEHKPLFYIHKNDYELQPEIVGAFIDLNGDGLTDWIDSYTDKDFSHTRMAWLNLGHSWERRSDYDPPFSTSSYWSSIFEDEEHGAFADVNGDGIRDWAERTWLTIPAVSRVYLGQSNAPDLLTGITDSLGRVTSIDYAPLTDSAVYTKGTGAVFPEQDIQSPFYVVKAVSQDDGLGGQAVTSYSYSGARLHLQGRGFLGFAEIVATDQQTGIVTTTEYEQAFPYIARVRSSTKTLTNGTKIKVTRNTWNTLSLNGGASVFPYVSPSVVEDYEINDGAGNAPITSLTTATTYDNFGNAIEVTATTGPGDIFSKATTSTYTNDTTNWLLGRLIRAEVVRTRPGVPSQTRVSSFAYDGNTGLLAQEVIEPDIPTLSLVTDYAYDGFGNKIETTVSGIDISTRTRTTSHTSDGRFATSVTNALNHSESWTYDARFGAATSLTGPNGLTTTWDYDGFGRKIKEVRADGTETRWTYQLCVSQCPPSAVYLVSKRDFITSSGVAITGNSIEYFDALNRVFRSQSEGFDGTPVYTDTVFNARGEVAKVSNPYFQGTPAQDIQWTETTYDIAGRPLTAMLPDGSVETSNYDGLTVTLTNNLSQTSSRTTNTLGELVSATDHLGGTVTYSYDAFGNLLSTNAAGVVSSTTYDIRGRKLTLDDPDMGAWSYAYNVLNELVSQTDAKSQTVAMTYDRLGRMVSRTEAEGTTTWTYDTATKGIGKVASISAPHISYAETLSYDAVGRPSTISLTFESETYDTTTLYDAAGRVDTLVYPTGFQVKSHFTANGHLSSITDQLSTVTYWQADTVNAEGQVTAETLGNGITTSRVYDPATRRIDSIFTTDTSTATTVQDLAFDFDTLGNLTARRDLRQNREEAFTYDGLNRLTAATLTDTATLQTLNTTTYAYDALGNLINKSDVGAYTYGAGGAGPHAVTMAGAATYTYDDNGSMIAGDGKTITWASFNKPVTITDNLTGNESLFVYGPSRARVKHRITDGGLATNVFYVGGHFERKTRFGQDDELVHYIRAAGTVVAIYTEYRDDLQAVSFSKTRYLHRDHLGSVDSVTDEAGAVAERLSYDAHGKRRAIDWMPALATVAGTETPRGFTGHEHLDAVGLVHMNGRVYDPLLGRFLSADPHVQAPETVQSFNRYSYVNNNPLSYTDPSGFFFKKLFKGIAKAIKSVVNASLTVLRSITRIPFVSTAVSIGISLIPGLNWVGAAALSAGFVGLTSIANGAGLGDALLAAGLTFGTAAAFHGIGSLPGFDKVGFLSKEHFAKVVAHGVVGGVSTELRGGRFQAGFLAGATTQFAAPGIDLIHGGEFHGEAMATRAATAAVVGGVSAELGGGKFVNGAVTGAFSRLYNDEVHGRAMARRVNRRITVSKTVDESFHRYVIRGKICSQSTAGCNAALADSVYDAVNRNDIPFTSDDLGSRRRELGWLRDPIQHLEFPSRRTSENITLDGHIFHEGRTLHHVYFDTGGLYYSVLGEGTGFAPRFNNILGIILFRPGVARAVRDYGIWP